MIFDLFYLTESNHRDPRTQPAKCVSIELHDDATTHDVITTAIEQRVIPRGSGRCGVIEIQTDRGIYTRVGGNRYNGNRGASVFTFATWQELEEAA